MAVAVEDPRTTTAPLLFLLRGLPPRHVDKRRRRLGVQQIRRDLLRRGVGDVAQREDDGEDADDEGEGVDLH